MFSLRKTLLTLGALLGASQLFTVRSSVYFAFLVRFQSRHSNASTPTLADRRSYGAFLFFKAFLYLAIGAYSQSGLTGAYLKFNGHSLLGHLTVDPLLATLTTKYAAANVFFLAGFGLFGFFVFYINYAVSLGLDTYLTKLFYQVICENPKAFFKLNTCLQKVPPIKDLLLHPVKSFSKIRLVTLQLWNPTQTLTFTRSRLAGFPYLSKRTRSRLTLLTLIYEHTIAGAALVQVFIIGIVVLYAMNLLCSDLSLSVAIAVFIDTLLLVLISWHAFVLVSFVHHALILFTFLTCSHLKEMNNDLEILFFQLKKRGLSNASLLLSQQLASFFAQHHSLAIIQQAFNEKMVSRFYLIAFLSGLFFQVVLLNILLLEKLQWVEKGFFLVITIIQTVPPLRNIQLLISWTDSLYSSTRLLFQAQGVLLPSENRIQSVSNNVGN